MATITLYPGAVRSFDVSYTDPATIVGAPPQWADGDDATLAEAASPASGLQSSPQATIQAMPSARSITSATLHVKMTTQFLAEYSLGVNFEWRNTEGDPEGSRDGLTYIAAAGSGLTDGYFSAPIVGDPVYALMLAGTLAVNAFALRGTGGTYTAAADIFEMWIDVDYIPAKPPPLRRYPANGNGATGPRRHYPRSLSRRPGTY